MITIVAHGIMGTTYRQDVVVDDDSRTSGNLPVLRDIRRQLSSQYGDDTPMTGWAFQPAPSGMWLSRIERAFDANYAPAYIMVSFLIPHGQRLRPEAIQHIEHSLIENHAKYMQQSVVLHEADWSFLHNTERELERMIEYVSVPPITYNAAPSQNNAYWSDDIHSMLENIWDKCFIGYSIIYCGKRILNTNKEFTKIDNHTSKGLESTNWTHETKISNKDYVLVRDKNVAPKRRYPDPTTSLGRKPKKRLNTRFVIAAISVFSILTLFLTKEMFLRKTSISNETLDVKIEEASYNDQSQITNQETTNKNSHGLSCFVDSFKLNELFSLYKKQIKESKKQNKPKKENNSLSLYDAANYLDTHSVWDAKEMEQYPDLRDLNKKLIVSIRQGRSIIPHELCRMSKKLKSIQQLLREYEHFSLEMREYEHYGNLILKKLYRNNKHIGVDYKGSANLIRPAEMINSIKDAIIYIGTVKNHKKEVTSGPIKSIEPTRLISIPTPIR